MWPSLEQYYAKGFGAAARHGDQLVGWCTAEYVSETRCGVGIETLEAFRGKNVATAMAARFTVEALHRGVHPHWECDARNAASAHVAEKAGFTLLDESTMWAGHFPRG
jgi:RimJ/RimL family protein N-acetyltransferase